MRITKLIVLLVLVVALAVVALQNQEPWVVRFLWMRGDVPGIILLFITTAAGFIAGVTVALLVKGRKIAVLDEKNRSGGNSRYGDE